MLDLTRYKAIVFDMDGTLIDSMGAHVKAWQQTCEYFGYEFDPEYMHSLGGVPTAQIAVLLNNKFALTHDPEVVAAKKRECWTALADDPSVIQQTCEVLDFYQGKLKMGIGTGSERKHALELLAKTGLDQKISTLVTASDVTNGKPHPETFLRVAELLGATPSECVVFEDTEIGRQAAEAANMDCILVKNGIIQANTNP
ncbi:beta-phosphoglucomutase family hydrolase [Paraglaciecola aquimarina]|uniref:Beta-phosphoglucomutase family hydrolase n=1 Tax=Paraglaciecola aquimarina TaxID=1235557 RepID=A0ABU3STH7_9ALTE|nr:beta-phosphoglucomutase family hydrolase [Paraglaciecola aquimarina]MDU0353315.1 beta-phosphoglucomutase family hydrolase [Paraglaciecola aquimarina]